MRVPPAAASWFLQVGVECPPHRGRLSRGKPDAGELLAKRIQTERGRFVGALGARPKARILIEASTESEWMARCLEDLSHEVIMADPTYAPTFAQKSRPMKGVRRDAQALAEAYRWGLPSGASGFGSAAARSCASRGPGVAGSDLGAIDRAHPITLETEGPPGSERTGIELLGAGG